MTKLCKDCKWVREPGRYAICIAPQNDNPIPETGFENEYHPRYVYCSTQRRGGWFGGLISGACGNGRWWQSK